jgi:hypothetical protein
MLLLGAFFAGISLSLMPPASADAGEKGPVTSNAQGNAAPQHGAAAAPAVPRPSETASLAADLLRLRDLLDARGWLVWQDAFGNTFLTPKPPTAAPDPRPSSAVDAPPPDDSGLRQLQTLLGPDNWRVARDAEGNVLLFPLALPKAPSAGLEEPRKTAPQAPTAPAQLPPADLDRVQDLLATYGWGLRRDEAGNTFLSPTARRAAPRKADKLSALPLEDLGTLLAVRGWDVATDPAGNWLLTPRSGRAPPREDSLGTEVPGTFLAPGIPGKLTLPVDTQGEAAAIAEAWLNQTSATGLAIGAVRRVQEIFLVSIVSDSPPHRLKNQLAIRSDDGLVVPLLGR